MRGRRRWGGLRLTDLADVLLRPAVEAAVAVARAGEDATPVVPAPAGLRPFLHFAKLPPRALTAARRALDADAEFRARVAGDFSEADVGRAGWLFLTRPDGWEDEIAALAREAAEAQGEVAERRAVTAARRRQAAADAAVRKAEEAVAQAKSEAAKATAALAEERQSRRAAAHEVTQLTRRLSDLAAELEQARRDVLAATSVADAAQARVTELEAELLTRPPSEPDEELADPAVDPPPMAVDAPLAPLSEPVGALPAEVARALAAAADAAGRLAESLASASAAVEGASSDPAATPTTPASGSPLPAPPASPPPAPLRPAHRRRLSPRARGAPPRRTPAPLPPAVLEDSPEAAEHLLRLPGVILLVDGYNVSNAAWPGRPIAEQRRRLVDCLTRLAARTGADVRVVFDGGDLEEAPSVPTAARPVHVSFSPPGVEADDVILGHVAELPSARPVVVATSDRRVRQEAARAGTNVVFSGQLLTLLR